MTFELRRLSELVSSRQGSVSEVVGAHVISINPDNTVNVMIKGVLHASMPMSRPRSGYVRVLCDEAGEKVILT